MNRKLLSSVFAWVMLLTTSTSAMGAEASSCGPWAEWRNGWIRLSPMPSMPMMAGFGRIDNGCNKHPVTIVSASSPAFAEVSLHESAQVDGVNRMREIEKLVVAPMSATELKPGGLHLMLMQPKAGLKEGDRVPVTLKLESGAEIHGELMVRKTAP